MKKKVLFIDRDGTLIVEPPEDFQVDSLEKLTFMPGVFTWLARIAQQLSYDLVMVTNQDGLGTDSFPEETFWPAQNKMMEAFSNEGIEFAEVLIDRSFPHEQKPTRKPGTAMLQAYFDEEYDLSRSYVIGDRPTDVQLAHNLGANGILFLPPAAQAGCAPQLQTDRWENIYHFLKNADRRASVHRKTHETDIKIDLDIDGRRKVSVQTGIGFFDHMLEQLGRHSGCDLSVQLTGDLHIDEHHTIEDTALALGEAYRSALGEKRGIERYGFYLLPMDEALAQVAIDFSGRPWLVWDADFKREKIGAMPTEMFQHFFKSFSDAAACNLNIKVRGENEHHQIEAIFKAFARAIKMAVCQNPDDREVPSTKGVL